MRILTSAVLMTVLMTVMIGASPAEAGELHVQGVVVNVEPITTTHQVTVPKSDCTVARPGPGASLSDWLEWDLDAACSNRVRQVQTVQAYRVYYEWDDRVYTRVMRERPGPTIPIQVNVE